jgi:hypothetical protein
MHNLQCRENREELVSRGRYWFVAYDDYDDDDDPNV